MATALYLSGSASSRLTVSDPVRPPAPVTATLSGPSPAAMHRSGMVRRTAVKGRCRLACAC